MRPLVEGHRDRAPEVELAPSQVRSVCAQAVRVEPSSADSRAIETAGTSGDVAAPRILAAHDPAGIAGVKRGQNYFRGFGPEGCHGERRGQNPSGETRGVLTPPLPLPSGGCEPGEGSEGFSVSPNFEPSGEVDTRACRNGEMG